MLPGMLSAETNACVTCHPYPARDFSPAHDFAQRSCVSCHAGDPAALELPQAHASLIAKPGDLQQDRTICAACHPRQSANVMKGLMNTGQGLVRKTRRALGEEDHPDLQAELESLGDSPADSMLRKLCARCHLAHAAKQPPADVTQSRGGGCSACHINQREANRHPRLSTQIGDERCFGCHSRSGRISMNYVGLAEADGESPSQMLRLTDGRTVVRRASDVHHQAGMGCIDCHTSTGLMGGGNNSGYKHHAVDIECNDCHRPPVKVVAKGNWPAQYAELRRYLNDKDRSDERVPLTRRYATPLWNVAVRADGSRQLHPKLGGAPLSIPDYTLERHPYAKQHERLTCSACHTQWAPLCYGCHSSYDPSGSQVDHLLQQETPGHWKEIRWDVRSELPPLGMDGDNRIRPVSPGMIMQVDHPNWEQPLFQRLFALSEPHTTGPSRSCDSCHRNSSALGLGLGTLSKVDGTWNFRATRENLQDGLPADAWTSMDGKLRGGTSGDNVRPFDTAEILRILNARIDD